MPHIIIEGPASVEDFYQSFAPIHIQEHDIIMKIREVYLSTTKTSALLDCIVVEDRNPNIFYMLLSQKDGRITVRLDPLTDPEKTDGVKRLVAIVGHKLKTQNPACRYGSHNLIGFIIDDC